LNNDRTQLEYSKVPQTDSSSSSETPTEPSSPKLAEPSSPKLNGKNGHERSDSDADREVIESPTSSSGSAAAADDKPPEINYTKQRLWQVGFVLVFLGSLFDFAALGFAAQSIVAPLG